MASSWYSVVIIPFCNNVNAYGPKNVRISLRNTSDIENYITSRSLSVVSSDVTINVKENCEEWDIVEYISLTDNVHHG